MSASKLHSSPLTLKQHRPTYSHPVLVHQSSLYVFRLQGNRRSHFARILCTPISPSRPNPFAANARDVILLFTFPQNCPFPLTAIYLGLRQCKRNAIKLLFQRCTHKSKSVIQTSSISSPAF